MAVCLGLHKKSTYNAGKENASGRTLIARYFVANPFEGKISGTMNDRNNF